MSNIKIEDVILQAIDIIATKKIASAGYDKTIEATIVSCEDPLLGKYKVRYQDSIIYAYSNNIDNIYAEGAGVYILVPNGDMSNNKTILSQTKRITPITKGTAVEDIYTLTGENIIKNSNNSYQISSYIPETRILYSADYEDAQNQIKIDTVAAAEYIKNSSHLLVSFDLQTELPEQQQYQGNYGLIIGLDFLDNSTQQTVTHYYTVDIDNVVGNPYLMMEATTQFQLYEIDSENFQRVNMIAIFSEDFPHTNLEADTDIYISNLELGGATLIEEADLDSYSLTLVTPRGYIFTDTHDPSDTRTVEARLKVKGNEIELNTDNSFIYWFVENASINPQSAKYQQYGGQGWECLNETHMKQPVIDEEGTQIVHAMPEFLSSSGTLTVTKSEVLLQRLRYKCVVVYNENVLTKEISMVNLDAEYRIRIESDSGTVFYFDNGSPTLTCIVQHKENDEWVSVDTSSTFNYIWGVTDYTGRFQTLAETQEQKQQLEQIQFLIDIIQEYLDAEYLLYQRYVNFEDLYPSDQVIQNIRNTTQRAQVAAIKQELLDASFTLEDINTLLENFDATPDQYTTWQMLLLGTNNYIKALPNLLSIMEMNQIIDGNKISKLNIKNIVNFSIYKCSVFFNVGNIRLGTGDITISNILNIENGYSLIINNGNQVFKYNSQGLSPTSNQNKNPLKIQELSFSLYDNLGNLIDSNAIIPSNIIWTVPTKETLLKFENYTGENQTDSTIDYKGLLTLNYTINDVYSMSKTNNIIKLQVQYKDLVLIATTNFTFTKEGALGTNGTDYICKIIPNVISGNAPENPTLYDFNAPYGFGTYLNWETDLQTGVWFKAQLWHNGGNEPIFEDSESGTSTENKTVTIEKWEILKNVYSTSHQDVTNINVQYIYDAQDQETKWRFSYNRGAYAQPVNQLTSVMPANIIKLTLVYDGYTYYATLPIIICRLSSNIYRVDLKDGTGFREVLYSSSGLQPEYNNNEPFELQVVQQISENKFEDITTKKYGNYHLIYHWYYQGSTWRRNNTGTWVSYTETTDTSTGESSKHWLMQGFRTGIEPHQKSIAPADTYDGECVNTAVACYIQQMDENYGTTIPVAWIHIPIHMMRNRYSNSAINSWDGNSVNLGGSNGGMILAPQVGAGIKEIDNSFTGMFIGTAKDPKESVNSNSISSLVGYYDEDVGLFGYYRGSRSVFIDAKTGRATFGLSNKGQIILDPTNETAKIYGGNYNTTTGTGLLIDLTTPEIRYGSGNFIVNNNGEITAKNANIQGAVTATSGTIGTGSNKILIGMDSTGSYAAIRSGIQNFNDTAHNGFYIGTDGIALGQNGTFKVNSEGKLIAKLGEIAGWTINSNSFFKYMPSNSDTMNVGDYQYQAFMQAPTTLNTAYSAFAVRKHKYEGSGNFDEWESVFSVNYAGSLYAKNANIQGTIVAKTGNIGYVSASEPGWVIKQKAIYNGLTDAADPGTSGASTSNGTYIGTDGIKNLNGTNYVLIKNGTIKANNVNLTGVISASEGKIGNWVIGTGQKEYNGSLYYLPSGSSFGNENTILFNPLGVTNNIVIGYRQAEDWVITVGNNFGISKNGHVEISDATIGRFIVNGEGFSTVVNGIATVIRPQVSGTGTYAISVGATYTNNQINVGTGKFKVTNNGAIYATLGEIGGFAISENAFYTKDTTSTSTAENALYLSSSTFSRSIAGYTTSNLKFAISDGFAVDNAGNIYIGNTSNLIIRNITSSSQLAGGYWIYDYSYTNIGTFGGIVYKNSSGNITERTLQIRSRSGADLDIISNNNIIIIGSRPTASWVNSIAFPALHVTQSGTDGAICGMTMKTNSGYIGLCTYPSNNNDDKLYVKYITNSNYNNRVNTTTRASVDCNITGHADGDLSTSGGTVSGQLATGGKENGSDKKPGTILSGGGNLYLQATNGSHIYFYYGAVDSPTSQLYESSSGTLTADASFRATGNLSVTTTSTTVERTLTVATGNVSGAIRANNGGTGGAFGLYATKTGNTTRNSWLIHMASDGKIYLGGTSVEAVTAIYSLSRSGTTVTYTKLNGDTGTFTVKPSDIGALATSGGSLSGALSVSGNISSTNEIHAGGKGTGSDGKAGSILSTAGHLYMQGASGSRIYFYYGTSTTATSQLYESASGTLSVSGNLTVAGTLTGYDYSGSSHVMVGSASDSSHRVGYLYHQNGTTVRVYGQAGGSGYTTYTSLVGTSSSDIRLKENIKDSKVNALNLINQIEITAFDWKTNWKDYKYQPIGMIADQIEKLDHRLVIGGGNDSDGEPNYKVIDDHYLSCYLTKGIQELYNKIEKLESEIKTLKENK